jgi:hypothetical protein
MPPATVEFFIATVASTLRGTVTRENPILECELPLDGSRFEALIPPSCRHRCLRFAARRPRCSRCESIHRCHVRITGRRRRRSASRTCVSGVPTDELAEAAIADTQRRHMASAPAGSTGAIRCTDILPASDAVLQDARRAAAGDPAVGRTAVAELAHVVAQDVAAGVVEIFVVRKSRISLKLLG